EAIPGDPEAQAKVAGPRDADARAHGDTKRPRRIRGPESEPPAREVGAVVAQGDAERAREIAGAAGQPRLVHRNAPAPRHRRKAADRLHRANEHAPRP